MHLSVVPPILPFFRLSLIAGLVAAVSNAEALGLGELRTRSFLGDGFVAEVEVLAGSGEKTDAACFRLGRPSAQDGLPWLQKASLQLREGKPTVLELRSEQPTRDPVMQVAIRLACGHELQRDYLVFLSPRERGSDSPRVDFRSGPALPLPRLTPAGQESLPARPRPVAAPAAAGASPRPLRQAGGAKFAGRGGADVLNLRLATELSTGQGASSLEREKEQEKERQALRLEYRLLLALNDSSIASLDVDERMRRLGEGLGHLRMHPDEIAPPAVAVPAASRPTPQPTQMVRVPERPAAPSELSPGERSHFPDAWGFYGGLAALTLLLAGGLGWRRYRLSTARAEFSRLNIAPELVVDPLRESEGAKGGKLASAPPSAHRPASGGQDPALALAPAQAGEDAGSDALPAAKARLNELAQVTPVMELADVMLSFGRVKGAAQALQEFIDSNPQEALQPWIRLLDVYRMAGMRDEFERLAQNLNQNFNVEVQQWDGSFKGAASPSRAAAPDHGLAEHELSLVARPKAASLEDMTHIRKKLVEIWGAPECRDYLHHLLRDNREGTRNGFPLSVVEEILFLIELDELRAEKPGLGEIVKGEKK